VLRALEAKGVKKLRQLAGAKPDVLRGWLRGAGLHDKQLAELQSLLRTLPNVRLHAKAPPPLAPGAEGTVSITLEALNPASRSKAFAPHFPKPKMAGWWLVMGEEDELLALKRVRLDRGRTTAELSFEAPEEPGEHVWSVLLVSDSYIGLDVRSEVRIVVEGGA
jgi:activating signal cointegrator complex subunit 3